MRMNNKPMYLCYILGQTEMGSEGMADIYYPMIACGDTDEEIVEDYRANLISLYGEDVIGEIAYSTDGSMLSYYPIHKVKIPKTVYGDPKSLSILLNYKPHCNAENPKYIISDEIASIMYTGGTMKRDNKNETHK